MQNRIGRALSVIKKNSSNWFEDERGSILPHFCEVKEGNHTLPCGLNLKGGDIIVYFVEHIFEKIFYGDKTLAVRGLKFENGGGITFIPLSLLILNRHQKKAFEVLHSNFPKEFFELKSEELVKADI